MSNNHLQAYEIYQLANAGEPWPRHPAGLARSAAEAARILGGPVDQVRGAAGGEYVAEPLPGFMCDLIETRNDLFQ